MVETLRIGFCASEDYAKLVDKLPSNKQRSSCVLDLHKSCGLLEKATLLKPVRASPDDLLVYHDEDYVDTLLNWRTKDLKELEQFGLVDDCPTFEELEEYVLFNAGTSIYAASLLAQGHFDHVIHWDGGRHHAKNDSASGFCYVNDIVLAINTLRQTFERVLYVDVDLHHGDAVEQAFIFSPHVLTFSLHFHAPGFFPSLSGGVFEAGKGKAVSKALNLPLQDGLSDLSFIQILETLLPSILSSHVPQAVVVVAGADGLSGDPCKEWNLTQESFIHLARMIKGWKVPTLWLGGGGYNNSNVARTWTAMMAEIVGTATTLPFDVPDTCLFYEKYAPSYDIRIEPGNRADNNQESLEKKLAHLLETIDKNKFDFY